MKNSRNFLRRSIAAFTATALVAACGGGSESSDTTERTRNSTLWSATTEPSKMVVFGTQDGLVQGIDLLPSSPSVSPMTFAEVTPNSLRPNGVVSVAVDTASSEVVYAGMDKSGSGYIYRTDFEGNNREVFTEPNLFVYGMGYNPSSRTAVLSFDNGSANNYILHSVDEVNSPIYQSKISYVMAPSYDGTNFVVAKGDELRNIDITNFKLVNAFTDKVLSPSDVWSFAADTRSSLYYGARQQSGPIVSMDMTQKEPISKVENVTDPASLAVFSDGQIVVGSGQEPTSTTGVVGAITIVDPSGAAGPVTLKGTGSGAPGTGVQSVWAVESPIATTAPRATLDSSGTLTCSDAGWREDLPLSRLSRSPISSVRQYTWFFAGEAISGEESETFVPIEEGKYSCAVTAANVAGIGRSESSSVVVVEAPDLASAITTTSTSTAPSSDATTGPGETVTTPVETPGTGESSLEVSPIVTIPAVSPGTPISVVTPTLRSAKWTFKGRTAKVTFRTYPGAKKYRLYISGATKKTVVCKSAKTTVTCTMTTLKKGINSFSAKALSTSGVTLAVSTKTRVTK